MSWRGELAGFVLRVFALIVALALVWPFFAPSYSRLVAGAGSETLGPGIEVWVDENGDVQADKQWQGRLGRTFRSASPQGVRGAWSGLLLVSALVLATPRLGWKRRLGSLAAAWALIYLFHVFYVTAFFGLFFSPGSRFYFWFPFSEVWVPLFIWAALIFRHWFPRPAEDDPSGE